MTPRQIREYRAAGRFLPRLFAFAYPMSARGLYRTRRLAFRAWCKSFGLYVQCVDL